MTTPHIIDDKPFLNEMVHYGVKGMHWGERRVARSAVPRQAGYSDGNHTADKFTFGRRGAERINERMSKGMGYSDAKKSEQRLKTKRNFILAGGILATRVLVVYGPVLAQIGAEKYVGSKAEAAGKKAAADLFSDSKGIGNTKIVDLGFDKVSGVWS